MTHERRAGMKYDPQITKDLARKYELEAQAHEAIRKEIEEEETEEDLIAKILSTQIEMRNEILKITDTWNRIADKLSLIIAEIQVRERKP